MKKTFFDILIDSIYPARCILCDEVITPDLYFCKHCEDKLEYPKEKRCLSCGRALKKCECNDFIYHFDSVISPFYNEGNAKVGFYHFKFDKDKRIGEFYASKMAEIIKKYHTSSGFHFVTSVCPSKKNCEYDHSGILAKQLSKELGVKYVKTLAPSNKKRKTQHMLGFSERFQNVHDSYCAIGSFKGKHILLVDDIKTSGATIDECARQLKFAGAEKVHCITALIGSAEFSD